ncbi:MAG TPA: hypothetical protein VFV82_04975 [Candidatus Binatia bacterium]|nr:hypothetical protein [Candidatus Binatia bacterium]
MRKRKNTNFIHHRWNEIAAPVAVRHVSQCAKCGVKQIVRRDMTRYYEKNGVVYESAKEVRCQ